MAKPKGLEELDGLSSYGSSPDANGNYTVIDYKRADGTIYMKSTLSSPDANLNYQTMTWQYYSSSGAVVTKTATWSITYDANNKIVSKVRS